jgi:hypothetical protein
VLHVLLNNISPFIASDLGRLFVLFVKKIFGVDAIGLSPLQNTLFGFLNGVLGKANHLSGLVLGLVAESLLFHIVHLEVVVANQSFHGFLEFNNFGALEHDQNVSELGGLCSADEDLVADIFLIDLISEVTCQIVASVFLGYKQKLRLSALNLVLLLA